MDAIALLKADHKKVEALFRRFEQAGLNARKMKRRLVDQIVRELAIHAAIEEQVFYPTVRSKARELEEMILLALEEHHVVKWLLKELENLPPETERFEAKVLVLMETLRPHIAEEEQGLFPRVRKAFTPAELQTMAQALMVAKRAAPTRPHPRAPDTPPGNLVAGTMSAVLDMGKDAVRALRRRKTPKAGGAQPQGHGMAHGAQTGAHTLM
jgi:hemerythrin superfamily protein